MNILAFIYIKCCNLLLLFQSKITSFDWPLLLAVWHLTRLILWTNVPPSANSAAMALNSMYRWLSTQLLHCQEGGENIEVAVLMFLNVCVFDEQLSMRFDFFDSTDAENALTFTSSDTNIVRVGHLVINDDTPMKSLGKRIVWR